ncbi:S-adenosylmethionine:tRNA ribosyltransferase-isomerase [Actinoallomurus rhizosphaericola]|uniref:S-adenosylmethionine:tRNA ribosyltransferase-isomerase n=1 Tax=Actinoallomurus rhizosphaericola TaxID=2952536 RepID=UPI0020920688|nr:S-adenosylmethionine:tRNA ribosyltransferase-isomerase [Actinoallomurus rhizosphaericola]MCO5994926.1 S-adenosylmethionine:tRNA ribosyltransferase-isomerase [Actinoallomurus rhizosphaericola]
MLDFALPPALEAHEPPPRRDGVRLLAATRNGVTHHAFTDLPDLLRPGDLLVVNTSATLPAAVRLDRLSVHLSGPVPSEPDCWLVELRRRTGRASEPYTGGCPGEWFPLPGGATLTLVDRYTPRLWRARLDTDVEPYLRRHGVPIRYGYVARDQPAAAYQTVFAEAVAREDGSGSAEMPSAGRPFTADLVTRLVARGVLIAPLTLHTGVASPEKDESPYPERYEVPTATAALVNHVRWEGGRVIAVGTTVVRALESAVTDSGFVRAAAGWTSHVVTPEEGVRAVDGLLTGLHEPRSSHLRMLTAIAGEDLLERVYTEALAHGYRWHEFGDTNLLIPH